MGTIYELLARAAALREETALNSISPERAGGIMYDTIMAINELWLQQGSALVISKIYSSVSAMEADDEPVSDITGQPLRAGQIVVIASSDSDNGSVYRFGGISEGASVWALVGLIGNITPVDALDSDSTQLPLAAHQGKVLDGKISQLGQYVDDSLYVRVYTDANDRIILAITKKGDIKFGAGVPAQIVDYINSKIDNLSYDINERFEEIESIVSTLNETFSFIDDHIWLNVTLDSDGHIVEGVRKDGTKYIAKYDNNIQKLLSDVPTYNDVKKHEGLEVEKRVITYSKTTPENTPDFNNLSNNLLIAFMTDTHIDLGNKKASYNNVKDTISFLNNLHVPIAAIIEGGDVVTPYSSNRQTHKEIMAPFFSRIKDAKMPVLYTKGNHDVNAIEAGPSQVLTDDDWGEVYFNWAEETYGIVRHIKSNEKKSGYYYYDLEDWKVRIICIDCNDLPFDTVDSRGRVLYQPGASTYNAQEQFSWIVNTALNFDDKDDKGWGVILFTHFYRATDVDGTSYAPIYASVYPAFNRMLAAFNSQSTFDEEYTFAENHFFDLDVHGDWTRYNQLDNKPFVICVLSGHVHTDQNYVKDGINNIWTANQFCGDYPADRRIIRIAGSNTQNLFDILSIDLLHRKIRAIRYGAGVTCFGEGGDRFIDNGLSF